MHCSSNIYYIKTYIPKQDSKKISIFLLGIKLPFILFITDKLFVLKAFYVKI